MPHPLLDPYLARVADGRLEPDAAQEAVARRLDALAAALDGYVPARKTGAIGWLLGARGTAPPRGLYIHGGVGRGKTMLMDLFFDAARVGRKRRVHFHAFMADAHRRIYDFRRAHARGEIRNGDDPIAPTAAALADESALLCFDEFAVTDIADAMLLGRLFEALFERGVVVVATSNVDPDDLYRDGLNRALFLPFIARLKERLDVVRLDARMDYRLDKLAGEAVYLTPDDPAATSALDRAFLSLTGGSRGVETHIPLLGREIVVPRASDGVARFDFADLCGRPLGANDYLELAQRFHTIIVDHAPRLEAARRNEARRFIILIDTLYDHRVKLLMSAAAPPAALYEGVEGREAFEFARTVSRLAEMGSRDYLAAPHGRDANAEPTGIVET